MLYSSMNLVNAFLIKNHFWHSKFGFHCKSLHLLNIERICRSLYAKSLNHIISLCVHCHMPSLSFNIAFPLSKVGWVSPIKECYEASEITRDSHQKPSLDWKNQHCLPAVYIQFTESYVSHRQCFVSEECHGICTSPWHRRLQKRDRYATRPRRKRGSVSANPDRPHPTIKDTSIPLRPTTSPKSVHSRHADKRSTVTPNSVHSAPDIHPPAVTRLQVNPGVQTSKQRNNSWCIGGVSNGYSPITGGCQVGYGRVSPRYRWMWRKRYECSRKSNPAEATPLCPNRRCDPFELPGFSNSHSRLA